MRSVAAMKVIGVRFITDAAMGSSYIPLELVVN